LLNANCLDVAFVSRQLGHANLKITLEVYAHLYQRADPPNTARDALDANHAAMSDAVRSTPVTNGDLCGPR
jgi:hypothetical protein